VNGDTARISVSVAVAPHAAFEIFTRDIDRWWRRGVKFRQAGRRGGFICVEPRAGGRLFESIDGERGPQVFEVGLVRVWEPPRLLVFSWRNANYSDGEYTEVEVEFSAAAEGTLVAVTHRGLAALRPDHPARHGLAHAQFIRMMGLWWGDQMTSLRETSAILDLRTEPAGAAQPPRGKKDSA
jgi:uncharacterized protein YndB with AHSA1/START domain